VHLSDLDLALALMTKVRDLYSRLDNKQKTTMLQILVKKFIVNESGEVVEHKLNAPFVYLCSLLEGIDTVGERDKRVDDFLVSLQFEQRGKLEELSV